MWAEQLGFLHATPKGGKTPRISNFKKPPLPDVTGGEYIRDAFVALRFLQCETPWQEMRAFSDCTGELSDDWEFFTVAQMAESYRAGFAVGQDGLGIPPYDPTQA